METPGVVDSASVGITALLLTFQTSRCAVATSPPHGRGGVLSRTLHRSDRLTRQPASPVLHNHEKHSGYSEDRGKDLLDHRRQGNDADSENSIRRQTNLVSSPPNRSNKSRPDIFKKTFDVLNTESFPPNTAYSASFHQTTCALHSNTFVLSQSNLSLNSVRIREKTSIRKSARVTGSDVRPKKEFAKYFHEDNIVDCVKQTTLPVDVTGIGQSDHPMKNASFYIDVYALEATIVKLARKFDEDDLLHTPHNCDMNTTTGIKQRSYCCAVRVRAPTGLRVVAVVEEISESIVLLYDHRRKLVVTGSDHTTASSTMEGAPVFISYSNFVILVQHVEPGARNRFKVVFQASSRSSNLRVRRTASNAGVVEKSSQTEASDRLRAPSAWARVGVPPSHVIMVSGPSSQPITQCVGLYAEDGDWVLETVCPADRNPPRAYLYNTTLLNLHVIHPPFPVDARFRVSFSFHNRSALPLRTESNKWNCSVPYRSDFLHHLSCNMEAECQDEDDETNCSYGTSLCGPGYLSAGGECFFYIRTQTVEITSNVAAGMCLLRGGGSLAIVNTKQKWKAVADLLPKAVNRGVNFFVGIRHVPSTYPLWYKSAKQWSDRTTALNFPTMVKHVTDCSITCAYGKLFVSRSGKMTAQLCIQIPCKVKKEANILCEKTYRVKPTLKVIHVNGTKHLPRDTAYVKCPLGHYTHQFLACDFRSSCWYRGQPPGCESPEAHLLPSFTCTEPTEQVPYTLVCDHRPDCSDGSDETFCSVRPCPSGQYTCDSKLCLPTTKICDGWGDCVGGEDESQCEARTFVYRHIQPPIIVTLSHDGVLIPRHKTVKGCPPSHVRCLDGEYCLPLLLRCNGAYDCPGREDEAGCDACPGFYRCRASGVCLVRSYLCDGHAHCPEHDDEIMCASACPSVCDCRGLSFFCRFKFTASAYPGVRFLDASGSNMTPARLTGNRMLVHLTLANCSLAHVQGLALPNLLTFNAEDNRLNSVRSVDLIGVPQLRSLSVAGNPLRFVFEHNEDGSTIKSVLTLDFSRVALRALNVSALSVFARLQFLNLSHSGVESVLGEGFGALRNLRTIDLRGCPMTWFPRGLFRGLSRMRTVHATSFKICCPAVLPSGFNTHNCFSQPDEISSCDDLLRGNLYNVSVFVVSLAAVLGNAVSFIFRTFVSRKGNARGYGNFVTHLSVSDFLMGVYLAIVGVAAQVYRGAYLWNDVAWRRSFACEFAGFLSLLSCEVSVLIMCLITLDRFLVLRFPFSRLHFSPASAHTASGVVWILGGLLVSVPLLPVTSHWDFYGRTGICIPLPITRVDFPGHDYSFSVVIVFNFLLFAVISVGQLSIYRSVRANSVAASTSTKKKSDFVIAQRLITVAMTDFMCWFPIGVLGLLASNGFPVPGELNAAMAIFVLPLNSAVNPCLYTVNVILERRTRAREDRLRKFLTMQLKTPATEH